MSVMWGNRIGVLLYVAFGVPWLYLLYAHLRGVPMDASGVFYGIMMPIVFFTCAAIGAYANLRRG
jgi:hypothetical protein